jgi:hypothetical protein
MRRCADTDIVANLIPFFPIPYPLTPVLPPTTHHTPHTTQAGGWNHSLYLRILDVRHHSLRVCAVSKKGTLSNAAFWLDPNYPFKTTVATSAKMFKTLDPNAVLKTIKTEPPSYEEAIDIPYEDYVPTANRYRVKEVVDAGDECMKFVNVPNGNHVLTVATDPDIPRQNFVTTVSHVIVF